MENRTIPIIYALLAAVFYAVKTPLSKLLLADVPVIFMAAYLYIRAQKSLGAAKTSAYYAVAPFVLCPHRGKADLSIFCGIADYDGGNGIRRHRYHSQKSCTPASAYLHTYA